METLGESNPDADLVFSAGVLTFKLGKSLGTYVINKQPPNKQIWLSSPVSGPRRFEHTSEGWRDIRNNERLDDLIKVELEALLPRK